MNRRFDDEEANGWINEFPLEAKPTPPITAKDPRSSSQASSSDITAPPVLFAPILCFLIPLALAMLIISAIYYANHLPPPTTQQTKKSIPREEATASSVLDSGDSGRSSVGQPTPNNHAFPSRVEKRKPTYPILYGSEKGGAKINSWDSLTVKAYKLRLGQGYSHEAAWNRTQNSSDQENRAFVEAEIDKLTQ
jgi:hypothetical protein